MRFRAVLLDAQQLARFLGALEKVDTKIVIHLEPESLKCVARNDGELGLQAFCVLKSESHFDDFHVESRADNHIYFKIVVANLLRALRSATNCGDVSMKLSKKNVGGEATPCLTLESQHAGGTKLVHDVPLIMMNQQDMAAYQEPDIVAPKVELYLPPMKVFRSVVDRLKAISSHVNIRATVAGELTFIADPIALDAEITFRNLRPVSQNDEAQDPGGEAEIKVDLNKLSRVLFADRMQNNDIIACFHEDIALVLHFLTEQMFMSYYIPLIALDNIDG